MTKLKDSSIALKLYKDAKKDIGKFECKGKIIDDDTTIVYEMFYESIVETGSLANDHDVYTLWLCTANVFCKCGEYHHIYLDYPAECQLNDIIYDIHGHTGVSFVIPSKGPEGSLIVPLLDQRKVSKKVEDIKFWL